MFVLTTRKAIEEEYRRRQMEEERYQIISRRLDELERSSYEFRERLNRIADRVYRNPVPVCEKKEVSRDPL